MSASTASSDKPPMRHPAYAKRYSVDEDDLRGLLARITAKNDANGARNPRAQFRKPSASR